MGFLDSLKKSAIKAAKETVKKGILAGTKVKAIKLAEKWPDVKANSSKVLVTVRSIKRDYLASYGAEEEEEQEVYLIHNAKVEEKKGFLGSRKVVKLLVSGPYKPEESPDFSDYFSRDDVWEIEVDTNQELEVTLSGDAAKMLR